MPTRNASVRALFEDEETGGYERVPGASAQAEDDPDAEAVEFHVEPGNVEVIQQRTQPDQDVNQRHMETLVVEADVAGGMGSGRNKLPGNSVPSDGDTPRCL